MSKAIRDRLLTSAPKTTAEPYAIDNGDGTKLMAEIRQPTVAQRDRIFEKAGIDMQALGRVKLGALNAWCVIECLWDPATGRRVFGAEDEPALVGLPPGSFVDDIGQRVWRIMNVEAPAKGKDSATTTGDASSSP